MFSIRGRVYAHYLPQQKIIYETAEYLCPNGRIFLSNFAVICQSLNQLYASLNFVTIMFVYNYNY